MLPVPAAQVRAHMVLQSGAAGGSSPSKAATKQVAAAAAAARQRRSLSLAVVLERARSRLQVSHEEGLGSRHEARLLLLCR